jgi:hypothetical protein
MVNMANSLIIEMRDAACAHSCRYCNMGAKRLGRVPRSRMNKLLDRFIDWQSKNEGFAVAFANGYSSESPKAEPTTVLDESERLNDVFLRRRGVDTKRLHLGGLKLRSRPEARSWMQAQYDAGVRFANASYAGVYGIHDYWNRREGDFQHLLELQRTAADVGMDLGQHIFVVQSTFSCLESLLDHLDALPRRATERAAILFSYIGSARDHEQERVTEAHREQLPDRIAKLIPQSAVWKSEREWIMTEPNYEYESSHGLWLSVDPKNIDWLETASCAEIVDDLKTRTAAAYRMIPSWSELRDRYGDRNGVAIYTSRDEVARKWLDRHVHDNPVAFERKLTHLRATF